MSTATSWRSVRQSRRPRRSAARKNIPVVVLPNGVILVEPSDPELLAALESAVE